MEKRLNIELERKAIYVAILDRENGIQKVIFQDSSFFCKYVY